jgi:hypothetical protein
MRFDAVVELPPLGFIAKLLDFVHKGIVTRFRTNRLQHA